MCEEHELEDKTERDSKSYGCKGTLPLKLEVLFEGIALSVGLIFYFLLTEHRRKQISTQCKLLNCQLQLDLMILEVFSNLNDSTVL